MDLCFDYALPGTDIGCSAMVLHLRYELSGTYLLVRRDFPVPGSGASDRTLGCARGGPAQCQARAPTLRTCAVDVGSVAINASGSAAINTGVVATDITQLVDSDKRFASGKRRGGKGFGEVVPRQERRAG
eukprot:1845730-Rhodomonas_salina.1